MSTLTIHMSSWAVSVALSACPLCVVGVYSFNVSIWLNALGQSQVQLGRAGNLPSLASTGQRLWSSEFWFIFFVCLVACLWLFLGRHERDMCAGGHAWSRSKCQVLMCYARYPFGFELRKKPKEKREREPLKQFDSSSFSLLFLYSGSSLMRLSNGCLPSASRLACQMCQNSSVRSLLRESAGCSPFSFPILIPFGISIRCPTCLPHLSLVFF